MQKNFKKLMAFALLAVMAFGFMNIPAYTEGKEKSEALTETTTEDSGTNDVKLLSTNNAGDFNVTSDAVTGWSYAANTISITESGEYTITGDGSVYSGYQISIAGNITVELTLSDVMISNSSGAAMNISNTATVTLYLEGDNSFTTTANGCAGIQFQGASTTSGGSLTITSNAGGSLTATGCETGAGIGGGYGGSGNNITISGGTVTAIGGETGAGIGGGYIGSGSNITITGGTVTATSTSGAGIGGGYIGSGSKITISGGTVTATSSGGAGIGGGYNRSGSNITITGGTVTATSTSGAGIGGGYSESGSHITITGGTVTATSETGAGIGGGYNSSGNNIVISNGSVKASSISGTPTDGDEAVYLCEIPNMSGVNSVTVDGGTYTRNSTDGTFYLYLTGKDHKITANGTNYIAEWNSSSNSFTLEAYPSDLTATYGDKLSDVELPPGWTWDYPDTSVGNVGINEFAATYTTSNDVEVDAKISVTVNPATPEHTIPEGLVATYGDKLSDVELPTGWTWDNSDTSVGDVGTNEFDATYTPDDTINYSQVHVKLSVTVEPATPVYTIPENLTATYGDKLSDVELPTGWTWDNPGTSVGDVGTNWFDATYTPEDINNYNEVRVKLSVTVEPATPEYTIPEGLEATYGDKLSDVELPTGWDWDNPDASVGDVGTNTFDATYTPDDILNYSKVQTQISVTVSPATPEYTIPENLTATYGDKLSDVELPTGWTWDNPDTSVGNVGTNEFDATYTPEDILNYSQVQTQISVTVNQATPEYTIPENLTATYGDKLSDVELPTGWTWDNPDTLVGNVGTHEFDATYTHVGTLITYTYSGTLNYSQVHVKVSVTVEPATPVYTVPENLTATYGDKLSDVELPTGWTWDYPNTLVGDVGVNEFDATYTPDDTHNYSEVHVKVLVTVEPTTPEYTEGDSSDTTSGEDQTEESGSTGSEEETTGSGSSSEEGQTEGSGSTSSEEETTDSGSASGGSQTEESGSTSSEEETTGSESTSGESQTEGSGSSSTEETTGSGSTSGESQTEASESESTSTERAPDSAITTDDGENTSIETTTNADTLNGEEQTGDMTSAQTGDSSYIALWIVLMLVVGAGLSGKIIYSRKRKYSR